MRHFVFISRFFFFWQIIFTNFPVIFPFSSLGSDVALFVVFFFPSRLGCCHVTKIHFLKQQWKIAFIFLSQTLSKMIRIYFYT